MRRDGQPSVMMELGTSRPCHESGAVDSQITHSYGYLWESQWTESTRPEDGCTCRVSTRAKRATTAGRAVPTAGKKFSPESQNRREENNTDAVIEYTYTLRGTTE